MKSWPHSRSFMFCMCFVLHTFPPSTTTSSWNLFITIFREEKKVCGLHTFTLIYMCINRHTNTHSQPARIKYDKERKLCESFQHKHPEQKACVKSQRAWNFCAFYIVFNVRKSTHSQQNTKIILTVREKREYMVCPTQNKILVQCKISARYGCTKIHWSSCKINRKIAI